MACVHASEKVLLFASASDTVLQGLGWRVLKCKQNP